MLNFGLCDFRIEVAFKNSVNMRFQFLTADFGYISDSIVNTIEVFLIKGNIELSVIRDFFDDIISSNQIWRGFARDIDGKVYEFDSNNITLLESVKWSYRYNNIGEKNGSLLAIEAFERNISLDSPSTTIDRCMHKLLNINASSNYAFIIVMNEKDYDNSDFKVDLNNLVFRKCYLRDKEISFYQDYVIDSHDVKNFKPIIKQFDFASKSVNELSDLSIDNCWALNNLQLSAIKNYYAVMGRNPTDVEVEFFAQSWSEHCKHTIFNSPIDDITGGLYKTYIRAATDQIIKNRNDGFCFSVFSDNAGAISLNDNYAIAIKVETHNSPCAVDPIGGAETGLLGVNRDIIGFGLGAKPIANIFCFCFAELSNNNKTLYVDANLTKKRLSADHIYEGVIKGIELAGNKSGIPTVYGSMHFGEHFNAKPLVFAGTIGLIPKYINERLSSEKAVNDGDLIVIVGNRTGKDGVHGATCSSKSDKDDIVSSTAQSGDPFTQKKVSDAIIKDARDRDLYNAITDNGAGGLSSSVGEMGQAGFIVDLDKVLLKYNDIHPWEIWVSESQERMTLAVSPEKIDELSELMEMHQVEMCIIGEFNYSGRGIIKYHGETVADVDLDMLCNKMPYHNLKTKPYSFTKDPLDNPGSKKNLTDKMKDNNLCSREFLFRRYDHTVQANILLYPIHGLNAIDSQTSIIKPVYDSLEGIAVTHTMSIIADNCDPFAVTALTIDESIRKIIVAGANFQKVALLDNFCWSNPYSGTRLFQLKEAARACYEVSIGMGTPFISGKDSMHNDFVGYNANANAVKVENSPTVLITAIGVIENCNQAISFDAKLAGDLIYQIGFNSDAEIDFSRIKDVYRKYYRAVKEGIIASAIAVEKSGLDYAIAKKLIANNKGADITIGDEIWSQYFAAHIVITVNPIFEQKLLEIFEPSDVIKIGDVNDTGVINSIRGEKYLTSDLIAKYKNSLDSQ